MNNKTENVSCLCSDSFIEGIQPGWSNVLKKIDVMCGVCKKYFNCTEDSIYFLNSAGEELPEDICGSCYKKYQSISKLL